LTAVAISLYGVDIKITRAVVGLATLFTGVLGVWSALRGDMLGRLTAGEDTEFSSIPPLEKPSSRFVLTHKAGELSCVLRLTFRSRGASAQDFHAELNQGSIGLNVETSDAKGVEIVLRGPGYTKFTWQGRDKLVVRSPPGARLVAWSISAKDPRYSDDSEMVMRRSVIRRCSTATFFALTAVLFAVFVVGLRAEAETALPLSGEGYNRLLSVVIGEVHGKDLGDTGRIQQLLNEILIHGQSTEIALKFLRPSHRWPLLRRAKILLDQQARRSMAALASVQQWASSANKN
jgi:hypothetical protein